MGIRDDPIAADPTRGERDRMATFASSFQALAEDSDLGMYRFSFHPELRVDYVNGAFEETVGRTLVELQEDPSPLWRSMPADAAARFDHARKDPDSVAWPLEFAWQLPDGSASWIQVREVQIRDEATGRLHAVIGVTRDVTAQRRQEEALNKALQLEREAADRLRRIDEVRRLFLQAVSHELRTPLTSVLGFAATLRDRGDDLSLGLAHTIVDRIHGQALRIERLLDDLLDIERLSRGVLDLRVAETDLRALIESTVAEHDWPVTVALEPVSAAVDIGKVERIVDNLVSNGLRHAGEDAVIRITLREHADAALIVVEDDGPGVPDEVKTDIFEPFQQGDHATGHASPGTGIGLTLVAEFARLHGGAAYVEDSPLGGARFVVRLPVAGPSGETSEPATETLGGAREVTHFD